MKFAEILKTRRKLLGLTQQDVADIWGIKSVNVSDWERGNGMPEAHRLPALAKRLGLTISELMGEKDSSNVAVGPKMQGKVPLISWVVAGEMCESPDNFHLGDADDWLDCPVPHSSKSYCLQVVGDSMDGEGGYRDGEIIFVDPEVNPIPGRDVIARTPDGKTTFKRLKQDTDGLYLLGLNGKKIIPVPEGTHICGVVIFSGFKR